MYDSFLQNKMNLRGTNSRFENQIQPKKSRFDYFFTEAMFETSFPFMF